MFGDFGPVLLLSGAIALIGSVVAWFISLCELYLLLMLLKLSGAGRTLPVVRPAKGLACRSQ